MKKHYYMPTLLCLLAFLLTSCSVPGVVSTSAQLPTVGTPTATPTLGAIHFPQDEAPHRNLTEWWYYTGHLSATLLDGTQHTYGFELVFFQNLRSDYAPYYLAHFAISDITQGQFHYSQKASYQPDAVLPNGTTTTGFNLSIANWQVQGLNGSDRLQASMDNYTIDLNLSTLKPPALHNGNGLITYGLAGYSYYYSRTRMNVSGTLVDHQQSLTVSGLVWMDHQWGNFLTLAGSGWDWYSLQLSDGSELMLYLIRSADNKTVNTYAGLIKADGTAVQLPANALNVTVLDHWRSPTSGVNYPSGWQLTLNSSQITATLTVQPLLKDQELVATTTTGNTYWEGASNITGQKDGKNVTGEGYVELTGYTK
jgi:predicted secreted hydrolase